MQNLCFRPNFFLCQQDRSM